MLADVSVSSTSAHLIQMLGSFTDFHQSKLFQIAALLAGASVANAHGHILNWIIDGETKNGGQPVYDTYGVSSNLYTRCEISLTL